MMTILEEHLLDFKNPHRVNAEQVGALGDESLLVDPSVSVRVNEIIESHQDFGSIVLRLENLKVLQGKLAFMQFIVWRPVTMQGFGNVSWEQESLGVHAISFDSSEISRYLIINNIKTKSLKLNSDGSFQYEQGDVILAIKLLSPAGIPCQFSDDPVEVAGINSSNNNHDLTVSLNSIPKLSNWVGKRVERRGHLRLSNSTISR
jgi:hypothetical protein